MGNGGKNTGNENIDENENINKQKIQSKTKDEKNFIKNFIESKSKDEKEKLEFIGDIMIFNSIDNELLKEMQSFKDGEKTVIEDVAGKKLGKYSEIDLSKILISDLKDPLRGEYTILQNNRSSLKEIILNEYSLESNKYELEVEKDVNKLTEKELNKLVTGKNKGRHTFLESIFGKGNLPTFKVLPPFFDKNNVNNRVKDKYKSLSSEEKKVFLDATKNIDYGNINSIDIQTLFEFNIFNLEEKQKIIETFLPFLPLSKAIELKLINKEEAIDYKKKIVKTIFLNDIEEIEIDIFIGNLKDDDILISSKYYTGTEDKLDIIGKIEYLENITFDLFEESQKSFDSFKKDLEESNKIKPIEKFVKGSTIIFNYTSVSEVVDDDDYGTSKKESTNIPVYYKIIDDGSETGEIKLLKRGEGEYNTLYPNETNLNFSSFLTLINGGTTEQDDEKITLKNIDLLTPQDLKEKIRSGNIIENNSTSSLKLKTKKEVINKLIQENPDKYNKIIDNLKETGGYKEIKSNDVLEEDKKKALDNYILDTISEIDDEAIDKLKESHEWNYTYLVGKLKNLDQDGDEFGLDTGTTFETKGKGGEKGVYTIENIDKENSFINLISLAGIESISFSDFYKTFKEKNGKRKSNVKNFEELFNSCSQDSNNDISGPWKNFEYKSNGIYKKETDFEYDYLVSSGCSKGGELIKIHDIAGDKVKISFGEVKDSGKDKEAGKKDEKKTIFSVENNTVEVTIGFLHNYIKNNTLIPRSIDEGKHVEEEDINSIERKNKLSSKIFQRFSISELIAGGKLGIESIENYLKEGNEEHAAKFAMGAFGKFLPDELKSDLLTRVETSQKKRMDDYIDKLKNVDSWIAAEMIEKWLLDKNCAEYKKEAGLSFMMEKYGVLYAKKGLNKYRGTFLWYEAMGGKIGDELYHQIKDECKSMDIPFAEEHLVYVLLVRQGQRTLQPYRRSRLHKEFKRLRAQGKDEEIKTGQTDGADERTIQGRINGAKGELKGGTYANAAGWLETVVNKGGSVAKMNEVAFLMVFSGVAYGYEQKILDYLKNFPERGMLLPLLRFMSYKSDIDLANETILELSKRISDIKGNESKYKDMGADAQEIFNDIRSSSITNKEKIENTEVFYAKYGEILTSSLYMLNDGKTSGDSDLNKIIFIEKDDYVDKDGNKHEGNKVFNKYYESFRGLMAADANFDKDELMTDAFKEKGISGLHLFKTTNQLIDIQTGGGFRHKESGAFMWEEISNEFDAVINRDYGIYDSKKVKERILKDMLRQFIGGVLENHSGNQHILEAINKPGSVFSNKLNSWGVNFMEFTKNSVTAQELLKGENPRGEKLINNCISIMLGNSIADESIGQKGKYDIGNILEDVQNATNDTISKNKNEYILLGEDLDDNLGDNNNGKDNN